MEESTADYMEANDGSNAPIPLVLKRPGEKLEVNPEAIVYLRTIKGHVVVLSIAGPYRSGKSYILNRVAGKQRGFALGNEVVGCTEGIWLWSPASLLRIGENQYTVILLDTEGLGDPGIGDKPGNSEEYDTSIFSLAILLSVVFLYNTKGTIDADAIKKLHFVTNIADNIRSSDKDPEGLELSKHFPSFLWVVRDFYLDLKDGGKAITESEYLERALQTEVGMSKTTKKANEIKECIKTFFPVRDCRVLPQPVNDPDLLKRVEELPESSLHPSFLPKVEELIDYIFRKLEQPKVLMNGAVFAALLESYVNAINNGAIPVIESAWEAAHKLNNTRAVDEAFAAYQNAMSVVLACLEGPHLEDVFEDAEISEVHERAQTHSVEIFGSQAFGGSVEDYQKQLAEKINAMRKEIGVTNFDKSERFCRHLWGDLHQNIKDTISAGGYGVQHGTFEDYEVHRKEAAANYEKYAKGPAKHKVASQMGEAMEQQTKLLLDSNKALSEKEKEVVKAKEAQMLEENRRIQVEQDNIRVKKEAEEQLKLQQLQTEQLRQQQQEELKRLQEQQDKRIENMQRMHKEALDKGLKDQADMFQAQVKQMEEARAKEATAMQDCMKDMQNQNNELMNKLAETQRSLVSMQHQLNSRSGGRRGCVIS